MKPEIRYLDTCMSDYFQGFGGSVYNVSPYGTVANVRDSLIEAINGEELFDPSGESVEEEQYEALVASVEEFFECMPDDVPWDKYLEEPEDDDGETPWSYFGVVWQD